ncbi:MAG: zinc ABC transporter substrate-binding protein [Phycisphaeraceae bacterium]
MRLFAAFAVTVLLGLVGCSPATEGDGANDGEGPADYPYTVVTTTGMVRDIVEHVAGEQANVTALMRAGVDPHLYSPTRGDVNEILEADIVFYNGLMLEGRMGDLFVRAARRGLPIYPVTEMLDPEVLLVLDEETDYTDPHVWMDVSLWSQAVDAVADSLAEYDPIHAEDYRENASAYRAELDALHGYAQEATATIPANQRTMITAHDAFSYFGRAYGLDVVGVQGLSTESSAGLSDINRLVDRIVENEIAAVFAESSVPNQNIRALIDGAGSRGHTVTIGGTLYSDAMGPDGTYEGTYMGMIDHNVTTITRALGGEAPQGGFQGKLTPSR